MENVTITGMEAIGQPRLTEKNHMILAYFSADVGVFRLRGCSLVQTARQGIAAWLPRLDHPSQHNQRQVILHDEPTRNALLKAAREMYLRMGGKHADYHPREPDIDGGEAQAREFFTELNKAMAEKGTVQLRVEKRERPPLIDLSMPVPRGLLAADSRLSSASEQGTDDA